MYPQGGNFDSGLPDNTSVWSDTISGEENEGEV
jgi:hypothetical protein